MLLLTFHVMSLTNRRAIFLLLDVFKDKGVAPGEPPEELRDSHTSLLLNDYYLGAVLIFELFNTI